MNKVHFILYVHDQERSTTFYTTVLAQNPVLTVPGMTEFELPGGAVLGLMPEAGIKRLLGENLPDPAAGTGIPRCEIYLIVDNASIYHQRALSAGAIELSSLEKRTWGDYVAYVLDPDGHVLALAERNEDA